MFDAGVLKRFQQTAELTDAKPFDRVDMFGKSRIRFTSERSCDNFFNAGLAGSIGKLSWINAVTGDDSEIIERLQIRAAEEL